MRKQRENEQSRARNRIEQWRNERGQSEKQSENGQKGFWTKSRISLLIFGFNFLV